MLSVIAALLSVTFLQAHPLGSGIGFKEEDKPNFSASFYSKTKVSPWQCPSFDIVFLSQSGNNITLIYLYFDVSLVRMSHFKSKCLARVHESSSGHCSSFTFIELMWQGMVEEMLKSYANVLTLRVRMPISEV